MKDVIWEGDAQVDPDALDARLMEFMAGEDIVLDRDLFLYDIRASRAHVRGLARIDVLDDSEARQLEQALATLGRRFDSGQFQLDDRYEDGHSAIEAWLIEQLGDLGEKVHTGRSRNDQVLVATRLYLRDQLSKVERVCRRIAETSLDRARDDGDTPMPGYTHLQRAMPSSTGVWFAAWAEAFIDNAALVRGTSRWIDANPLGTAAGYGVNLALDRDGLTEELGFDRTQINPIYAQNSRGKFELQVLMALGQSLLDLRRLAWDLSLFTTAEFGFVVLPDRFTTGSSIMPNKRNPDVVELLRATAGRAFGAMHRLESTISLPSGYHRDLQETKGPVLRALARGLQALHIVPDLLGELSFEAERCEAAIDSEMYATDRAIDLTADGVPFREAYRRTKDELEGLEDQDPRVSLQERVSLGGPANLGLDRLRDRLDQFDQD